MLCSIRAEINEAMPFHAHPPHELIVCLDDNGALQSEGDRFLFSAGRTFLLPSGLSHAVIGRKDGPANTQFICFDSDFLNGLGVFPLTSFFTGKYTHRLVACAPDTESCANNLRVAKLLQQELDTQSIYGETLAKALLTELLISHLRHLQINLILMQNSKRFAIERCCRTILDNLSAPHCLTALAREVGMSRSAFSMQFKQHTGMSLVEFVNVHRVRRAQWELQWSHNSVTEIAFSLGFGNLGHFYSVFKKQVGMTPSDYRLWILSQFRRDIPKAFEIFTVAQEKQ